MDQQIKLFLVFLEQCRLQSRVSSTKDVLQCLDDLQHLLESIDQSLINNNQQVPPLLYPSLGSLLEHLCRNPVVLATSEAIVGLVTSLVLKYSQTSGSSIRDKEMELWCSDRMSDLLRTNTLKQNANHPKAIDFQDLFNVSSDVLQEQLALETIESTTNSLGQLQRALEEMGEHPRKLMKWTFGLSELCAPLLGDRRTVPMTEQIISTAYLLNTKKARLDTQILSANFCDGVNAQYRDLEAPLSGDVSDTTMKRLWTISPPARQKSLIRLLDTIIKSSATEPDFFLSQKDLFMQYFDRSGLLRFMSTNNLSYDHPGVGSLLEDMTGWLGEIPDWRLVRIGTAMVGYLIGKYAFLLSKGLTKDIWTKNDPIPLNEMLLSATAVGEQARQTIDHIPSKELEAFSQARSSYIYGGGDSAHLAVRRRVAFMVGTAIARQDNFLVRCVRIYLFDQQEAPPNGDILFVFISRLLLGNDNANQISSVAEKIKNCFRRLQSICSLYVGNSTSENTQFLAELRSTLEQFEPILLLNTTVAADIVCGLWLYLDQGEIGLSVLQLMIDLVIRLSVTPVTGLDPPPPSSLPFVIRLRDILDSSAFPGLDIALAPFLQ